MTTPKDNHKDNAEVVEEKEWTRVQKVGRDRSKSHLFPKTSQQLNCLNGFEALGVLIDHHVAVDRGPCGKMVVEAEYVDYNDMLGITGVCEMDSKGDFFTWSNKQCTNPIYSRIDRIIANVEWLQDNGNLQLNVLSPHISDHFLLYLSDPMRPRQRKRPFRFNNNWIGIEGFQEVVKDSWTKPMTGKPMEVLWKKLARLQLVLRALNKPINDLHIKIAEARNNLELAYNDLRTHQMDAHIMERIKVHTEDLIKWNDMEATSLMQRTKINWIKMGDENNTYFQAYLKARGNTKSIQYLQKEDGSIVTSQKDIEAEFLRLYGGLMGKANLTIHHIDVDAMRRGNQLDMEKKEYLISRVTIDEIQEALKGIGDLKSPGVDGYGARILTKRLGRVFPSIVSLNQAAFIQGQMVHNHIMLDFELIKRYTRKGGPPKCMIQLDLQKAYDMAKRGLRQGDPISPLLFVLMMEYFDRLLKKMQATSDFKFHSKCEKVGITNLTFADDILLFCRGDTNSVQRILKTVQDFSDSTWLVMSPSKCQVFCGGMEEETKDSIVQLTGFAEGQLPMKYLGVPITSKRLSINHYLPLIDKIMNRITHWTAKLLSYSGRLLLVRSVLMAITQYWMQCLPLPQFVINKIESMCRTFVWTGNISASRKSPVAWKTVCKPKAQGGLRVINLTLWNKITIIKCLWNLCRKSDNMWVKWVHMYYLKGQEVMETRVAQSSSWVMKRILELRGEVQHYHQTWTKLLHQQKFKMHLLYDDMIEEGPLVDWRCLFQRNAARPQARFLTWLLCHGKLATKDRLHRFNMITNTMCSICQETEESIPHLFFDCKENAAVWTQVLNWLGRSHQPLPWAEELSWLTREVTRKGWRACLLKIAFTETVYGIWSRRNSIVFKHSTNRDIIQSVLDNIVYRGWQYKKTRKQIALLML
ncbi:uncharacterized protein LOC131598546 [Vicia villosa]|uniref:uncharacterized protein LOC131598546 n=1 Tax=Vicia villosa TaxID=3911 RepID=UPI00273AFDDA|nr:uncharacterized protein LOC131598546 [Vicia villosa]